LTVRTPLFTLRHSYLSHSGTGQLQFETLA
jgi:hypothetical protein